MLKAYLEEVVLKPVPSALKVEYHLRKPQVKNYELGPTFLGELEKYAIYDQLFPASGRENALPSAPISERYKPRLQVTARQRLATGAVVEVLESLRPGPSKDNEAQQAEKDAEAPAGYDAGLDEPSHRNPSVPAVFFQTGTERTERTQQRLACRHA